MPESTQSELIATVRSALENGNPRHEEAWFALGSLVEQYASLEELVREYEKRLGIPSFASGVGRNDA